MLLDTSRTARQPRGGGPGWVAAADKALGLMVEIPAGALVLVETVILFAGVVARYVVGEPLTWSDELASILFRWLAMLGSVVALRRKRQPKSPRSASWTPSSPGCSSIAGSTGRASCRC